MATPKATKEKKIAAAKPVAKKKVVKEVRYVGAVGRRKTAIAQVRLYPVDKPETATVNGRPFQEYFGTASLRTSALAPLVACGLENAFQVSILVRGGGQNGQADAVKLGVARALLQHDVALRPALKAKGFLTRDSRAVERKKPGLKKARRSPQWAKR